jgi:uncharacterized membrane protein YkvA (DUF1232 family)
MKRWTDRARRAKLELLALYFAARHPQTPWYAKVVVAGFVAYAITPVDFFPDALPILGIVDDLVFVPLAVALAVRFVPSPVLAECRAWAHERISMNSKSFTLVLVVAVWTALAAAGIALYI